MNEKLVETEFAGRDAPLHIGGKGFVGMGVLAGLGAVLAAASCCVLPLALAALGVGAGLSAALVWLEPLRGPLTALSLLAVAGGWWAWLRRRNACSTSASCAARSSGGSILAMLVAGTALVAIALVWNRLEAPLMKAIL